MRNSVLVPVSVVIRVVKILRAVADRSEWCLFRSPSFVQELSELDDFLTAKLQAVKDAEDYEERIKNKTP